MATFKPAPNKVYRYSDFTIIWIDSGFGSYQVDFQDYMFTGPQVLFLAPGQYFKLVYGDLRIHHFSITENQLPSIDSYRYLFKHIVAVGHIDLVGESPSDRESLADRGAPTILDFSLASWKNQNPLKTSAQELDLIFNLKDIVDQSYDQQMPMSELVSDVYGSEQNINAILRRKLNATLHNWVNRRVMLEAQRNLFFTSKSIKEIAYELGFNDPSYFNRFFKRTAGLTPASFRQQHPFEDRDHLLDELGALIEKFYKQQRNPGFYAESLAVGNKSLLKKVKERHSQTTTKLIQARILGEAKKLLNSGNSVADIAFELGFKEPNHFTSFFKSQVGETPSQFISKKVP